MIKLSETDRLTHPKNRLNLYGYNSYFDLFINLYEQKKLPSVLLISGPKGSGKATFIYHFINYLLSINESEPYNLNKKEINYNNKSYKLLNENTHSNFFSLENQSNKKNVGIDDVRNMISFLNKSTFSNNLKLFLIDNIDYLNINSTNALLKCLEEINKNTYFFIITHNSNKVTPTIKSRSIEFKIFQNYLKKKEIFLNLIKDINKVIPSENTLSNLNFDTPGNLLRCYEFIDTEDVNKYLKNIFFVIERFLKDKNIEDLSLISLLIEKFYSYLLASKSYNQFKIFFNKNEILNKICLMKKFNLDPRDTFFYIENILKNEKI